MAQWIKLSKTSRIGCWNGTRDCQRSTLHILFDRWKSRIQYYRRKCLTIPMLQEIRTPRVPTTVELNSSTCPHCRTELPNERDVAENLNNRNWEVSPRQLAINALQTAIQDRTKEQRIDSVSLTCVQWTNDKSMLVGTHDKAVKWMYVVTHTTY